MIEFFTKIIPDSALGKGELSTAVSSLRNRTFIVDKRSLIHLDASEPLFSDCPYGLNEFAIHKTDSSPMIKIHTYLNGGISEYLLGRWVDSGYAYGFYGLQP